MCWRQGARWRLSAVRPAPSSPPISATSLDCRSWLCCAGREEALPYYAALRGRADYAASAPPWQRALLTFQHANLLTERGADGDEEEAEALYGEIVAEPVRTKPAPEFSRAGRLESELPFVGRTRTSTAGSAQRMSR